LIRGARQLLTLRGPKGPRRGPALAELNIIHDGALLVRDGVLVEVGTTRRVENLALARKAVEVNAVGRVVMPGFVDSHTHLLFPPPGSSMADVEYGPPRTLRSVTGMRLAMRARVHLEAMARHGTTTVEVKTGCGSDVSAEMKLLRVLARVKREPLDVVATFLHRLPQIRLSSEAEIEAHSNWICGEFLPKLRRRRLAGFVDIGCEERLPGEGLLGRYLETARCLGFGGKVHVEDACAPYTIGTALEHGAVSIDHLENVAPEDAALLGKCDTVATLLPCASFHRDGRYAPARMLIDAGAPVALATNFNPHLTPTLNMQTVVKLACVRMGMTPEEAISAGTINGAHALRCADRIGSLEPGKLADLLILNISDYRELAHHFGTNLVQSTMKRGELIYEEGEVAPRPLRDLRPEW
jgi:imidazolonepropionase